jgi:hypothetical protein
MLGGKNDHKMFASTLAKLSRASVIEARKFATGGPPKQELVKFGPLFLVDMDGEKKF